MPFPPDVTRVNRVALICMDTVAIAENARRLRELCNAEDPMPLKKKTPSFNMDLSLPVPYIRDVALADVSAKKKPKAKKKVKPTVWERLLKDDD